MRVSGGVYVRRASGRGTPADVASAVRDAASIRVGCTERLQKLAKAQQVAQAKWEELALKAVQAGPASWTAEAFKDLDAIKGDDEGPEAPVPLG